MTGANGGSIVGWVRGPSGKPLQGALVKVTGAYLPGFQGAATDEAGRFTVPFLPWARDYRVHVSAPGCVDQTLPVDVPPGAQKVLHVDLAALPAPPPAALSYDDWVKANPGVLLKEEACTGCEGTGTTRCEQCGDLRPCGECDGKGRVMAARRLYKEQREKDERRWAAYQQALTSARLRAAAEAR